MGMDAWLENCFAEVADPAYREFNARILHTVDINRMVGVRTPDLRRIAREAAGRPDIDEWLTQLPHERFEAMQVHAFLLSGIRDYDRCVHLIDAFLPHVDNWATCDQLSPQVLAQRPDESLGHARRWMASTSTYTCRFGIGVLMRHFLGERFVPEYLDEVARIDRGEDYYVNMMRAWCIAEAVVRQPEAAIDLIERRTLDRWTHNKAIQKAVESRRVPAETKDYLRTLRMAP